MKTLETILPAGRILEIKELPDGRQKVIQEVTEEVSVTKAALDDKFILIDAESLSLKDKFMDYLPKNQKEENAKELIAEAIKSKVKNFYRPIMDPSFSGYGFAYVAGNRPAVGECYQWWVDNAKKYDPSRKSRLGTRLEYGAFLGVLIKKLVEEGKSVNWAWNAVCTDSKELGHYANSENTKHELELTGSRLICGFYDLGNTYKILADEKRKGIIWIASGSYSYYGYGCPIAHFTTRTDLWHYNHVAVGWLVLS